MWILSSIDQMGMASKAANPCDDVRMDSSHWKVATNEASWATMEGRQTVC